MKRYALITLLTLFLIVLITACQTTPAATDEPTEPAAPVEATDAPAEPTDAPAEPTDAPAEPTEVPEPTEAPMAEPLVVLIDNDEGPISPANYNTFIGLWMVGWVYDSLYIRTPNLDTAPHLATSTTASLDGLTWEIELRDDVAWHDGEAFDAEDVVFSYEFLIAAGRAPGLTSVDTIEATGDHSLVITLSTPNPFFLEEGLAATYIMPQHIWQSETAVSGELSQFQGFIGTGAFKLVDVLPGEAYTLEANPDYFLGKPQVDVLIAKIVKDRTQQFNQLQSGAASAVLSAVTPALVEQLAGNDDIALAKGSDFFNYILYTNGSRPPFDNPDVRGGISLAIDSQTLVDVVLLGQGTVLPQNWYHPELPWSINEAHDFDPTAAAAAFEAAGLTDTDGDGVREFAGENTAFEILCDVNSPVEVRTAELIASWLVDVGIGAAPRCQDIDTSVAQVWPNFVAVPDPDYDMAIWGWSAIPQFRHGFIRGLFSCDFGVIGWGNLTGLCDEEFDNILNEFVALADLSRVGELSADFQNRFVEITPWVPLMSPDGNFAYVPADYDGWTYLNGTGIVTVWSFLPEDAWK